MSRVLLSFPSPIYLNGKFHSTCFYEGFINALQEEGNELMVINTYSFLHQSIHNQQFKFPPYIDKEKMVADVKRFNPELVITFNHSIPLEVEEACNCPITIWDVDSFDFLCGKDHIGANLDKYIYIELGRASSKKLIAFGAPAEKVHVVRSATAIQAEKKPFLRNIAFIGNPFYGPQSMVGLLTEPRKDVFIEASKVFAKNFYTNIEDVLSAEDLKILAKYMHPAEFKGISSGQNRITTLNDLSDLGLTVWGPSTWLSLAPYLPQLAMAYEKKPVFSLQHNQDVYNSSKIGISISHAQAADGYPWRVMDIMASNGCMLSDYHSGIDDLTKGYVKLPMFHSHIEARELAAKILKDEAWRQDLVAGSQACIEATSRWHHRFKELEHITGISLLAISKSKKTKPQPTPVIHIERKNYLASSYTIYYLLIKMAARCLPSFIKGMIYKIMNKNGIYFDSHIIRSIRG
ncbi:MAG: glycosyltransferase family 1 protein [Blastochloris viridis]|uniref:Glycosyltransferase family 1 protein n=1 Tax=Blastochloris viridis TaxID=1079 RepID=A0A6N4R1S6_BLAVI|nr:MAG: glycosyltransferase family 1 protein [Blastochloris viridis]